MNKTITLTLTFRSYNKVKDSTQNHPLILLLLPYKKQAKTYLQIPPFHWDKEKQVVKPRFRKEHETLIKEINHLMDRFSKYPRMILEGDIHPDNVINDILKRDTVIEKDLTVWDYIDNNRTNFGNSFDKHLGRVSGVEKALRLYKRDFGELKVSKLNQFSNIEKITQALRKHNIADTTRSGYMQTLDRVTELAELTNKRPFKKNKLFPKNPESAVQHRTELKPLFDGIKNITTYKDIEAYLWFLYSYCLQGLDAVDIANIDESAIHGFKDGDIITHFYEFGDFIGTAVPDINDSTKEVVEYRNQLLQKRHIKGAITRGKTKSKIYCLVNLFPTLFIRDWLHHIVKITRPDIAYKGNDRLRIFNFKTYDSKGNPIEGSHKILKGYMTTPTKKMKKLFGGKMRAARTTFTQLGKAKLGLDGTQMKFQLNHKRKGALHTYEKGEEAPEMKELIHSQLFNLLKIKDLVFALYDTTRKSFREGNLLFDRKEKAIPGKHRSPSELVTNDMILGWALLNHIIHNIDSEWSTSLEKEFNQIKIEHSEEVPYRKKDGFWTTRLKSEDEYPKRYHELNDIRKKAFGDFNLVISKNGGISLTPKAVNEILESEKILDEAKEIIEKGSHL